MRNVLKEGVLGLGKCARNIHREPVQGDDGGGQDSGELSGVGRVARAVNVVMQVAALDVVTGPENIMDA